MKPRIYEPENANRAAAAIFARVGVPALCLAAVCLSCLPNDSGDGNASDDAEPYRNQFLALAGSWSVVGSDVTYDDPAMPQAAIGLEANFLQLEFLSDGPVANTGSYAAVYLTSILGCDTTSPSFGEGKATVAVAQQPEPVVAFDLVGAYYRPADDVTVTIARAATPAEPGNAARYAFAVYGGRQLVSVQVDQPGVDDDGDGLIDEPGEFTLFDEIAQGAVLIASGEMTLRFIR